MEEKQHITVLGLGNILLQDEGFGVHFVNWFSARHRLNGRVKFVDGGTLGYGLLDIICSTGHLIVVDVVKIDDAPGSVYRFSKDEMDRYLPAATSAHEVTFPDVLCKAELMGQCPEVVFLCIVPQHYEQMETELTPVLQEKFPDMEKLLVRELSHHNISS